MAWCQIIIALSDELVWTKICMDTVRELNIIQFFLDTYWILGGCRHKLNSMSEVQL